MAEMKKKRRLGCLVKLAAVAVVLLVVLVVAGPLVAAPFVKSAIEAAIEAETGGEATIEELSFSLFGSAEVAGIDVRDPSGRPLGTIEQATATFSPLDLLSRRLDLNAEARGVALHVRLDEGGTWNFEEYASTKGNEEADEDETVAPSPLPDVGLRLQVADARVLVHGPAGTTSITGALDIAVADLAAPAPLHLDVAIAGPDGAAGSVRVTGEITAAADGREAGIEPTGNVEVQVEALDLAAFEHLVAELAPITELAGVVAGRIDVTLARNFSVRADTSLALDGFRYQGPEPDARLSVAQVRLEATSASAEGGGFSQTVRLTADEFLTAVLDGTWQPGEGERAAIAGTWQIDASLAGLTGALHAWLPLREGFSVEGNVGAHGDFDLALDANELRRLGARVDVAMSELEARDEAGEIVPLDDLAELTFASRADLDFQTGLLSLGDLELAAGSVRVKGTVEVNGLLADPGTALMIEDSSFAIDADLDRLRTSALPFIDLEDLPFGGSLHADLTAQGGGEKTRLLGEVHTSDLVFGENADGSPRDYGEIDATLDAWYIPDKDRLKLTVLKLQSEPVVAKVTGKADGLTAADGPTLDFAVEVQTALERVLPLLPLEADFPVREAKGEMTAQLAVRGALAEIAVEGHAAIVDLVLALVTETTGEEPWVVAEPSVTADVKAVLSPAAGAVRIDQLKLDSAALRAEVAGHVRNLLPPDAAEGTPTELVLEGVHGEAHYIPDRMGALLAPWLPGTLSGADEEKVTFAFDGRARDVDLLAVLTSTRGTADFGLGRFETGGFDTAGSVHVELVEEKATWSGTLAANGGSLALNGEMDLRETAADGTAPRSTLEVGLKEVGANSKLSPLMGLVHPAFSAASTLQKSEIGGLIDCNLDLAYEGPVTADVLTGGWEALPKRNISGTGSFSIRGASLTGSPLFGKMLQELGLDPARTVDIKPVEFSIEAGRVKYAKPWSWTIGDTKTTFTGSVGLDETIALTWNVPIDDALVQKYDFLSSLRGESIQVPLGGTVRAPTLEWKGLLADLASKAAKNELANRIGLGNEGDADGNAAETPAGLLTKADRLWKEGKKVEAAAIYKRIREKYKVSMIYALNRDKIKERAEYREGD